jgi:vacuolar-type H+-ATPase subunit E/Vma4
MEELIATLEREADERCAALVAEAEREAQRVREAAESRFARRRQEAERDLEEELRRREVTLTASVRTQMRRVLLRARRGALDRVFRRAAAMLPGAVRTEAWGTTVPGDLRQALECLGDADVEVICQAGLGETLRAAVSSVPGALPADEAAHQAAASEVRRVRVTEREDADPGFEVCGAVTGVRVDVTLPTRLTVARPELEMRVLGALEEDP